MKIIIIGSGFAGSTAGYLLSKKGHDVTILEGRDRLGGDCHTYTYGGHPYTFGPRMFFTEDKEVFDQMTSLLPLRPFSITTESYVEQDHKFYNYPIHYDDIYKMKEKDIILKQIEDGKISGENFETYWKGAIGDILYEKFINTYSKKMWGIEDNKVLSVGFNWVNKGIPIRSTDKRLYKDMAQGFPYNNDGYNQYFVKATENCTVKLKCYAFKFSSFYKDTLHTSQGDMKADIFINTGHLDSLLNYKFGELKWFGRKIIPIVLPVNMALSTLGSPGPAWIHYTSNEPYTRITEFKRIFNYSSPQTLLGIEFPTDKDRHYPLPIDEEIERYEKYKKIIPQNLYSIGRAGTFKYKNISDAIREAIDVANKI